MSFDWTLYTRGPDMSVQGEIEDFTSLRVVQKFNDVGTFELTLDRRSAQAVNLQNPGWGIVLVRNGVVIMSGIVTNPAHAVSLSAQTLTVTGMDDMVVIQDRQVSPSPSEAMPPYTVSAEDVRTALASTVLRAYVDYNAGPHAVTPRRTAGLTIGVDPLIGPSITGRARWQPLLTFLQDLATSANGIGFRVVQTTSGREFQVYAPTDRTDSAVFSIDLGNLTGYSYSRTRPTSNYAYVGGSGDGTARVMYEQADSASVATWNRIEGPLVDSSASSATTELAQAATDALTQGAEKTALSIAPIDTPALSYGTDYFLGDKVTIQLEGAAINPANDFGLIKDVVRTVEINLTPDGPQTVSPNIGTANNTAIAKIFDAVKAHAKRLNNLERR